MQIALGALIALMLGAIGGWLLRRRSLQRAPIDVALGNASTPQPVFAQEETGLYRSIEYRIEISAQGVASLSFALEAPLINPLEVDARAGFEPISELTRGLDIRALIAMGANYIDIGATDQRVSVEFPPGLARFERTELERILGHLLRLRDLSSD